MAVETREALRKSGDSHWPRSGLQGPARGVHTLLETRPLHCFCFSPSLASLPAAELPSPTDCGYDAYPLARSSAHESGRSFDPSNRRPHLPGDSRPLPRRAGTPYCCPGIRLTGSVPPTSCSSVGLSGNPFIICRWSVPEGTSLRPGAAGFEADAGSRLYNLQMTVVGGKGDDVAGQAGAYG